MTLSNDKVINQINTAFVSGWQNIKGKKSYAGVSNTHMPSYAAKNINTCSGGRNIQMYFMTPDGRVVHCLPGYWNAADFYTQAGFAVKLGNLAFNKSISNADRNEKFLDMHLQKAHGHNYGLVEGAKLQGFDVKYVKNNTNDFTRGSKGFVQGVKLVDQVVHERMAARPFLPFEKFDAREFTKLGIKRYKYDFGLAGKYGSSKSKEK